MGGDMQSSLPLQIAVHFNGYYSAAFAVVMLLLYIYKSVMLLYPPNALGLEVAFVFLFGVLEAIRLHFASRGNKMELITPLIMFLLLTVPVVVLHSYWISLQTYVLRLDVIINGIGLAFCAWEALFGVLAALNFWRAQRF